MIAARTDVVGSLLRPRELLEAREGLERGEIGPSEFKWVEDAAVDAAVRLQEDAGLAVVTDGEMRRLSFQSQFTGSGPLSVIELAATRQAASRMRLRSRSNLARPYICLLIILMRLTVPSTVPELWERVSPLRTAW